MEKIAVGIDIGTHHVKVVIAQRSEDGKNPPRILGTGYAESRGLRHGYIISVPEVARGVAAAVMQASRAARVKVKKAYLSVGGIGLEEAFSRGEAVVERGDSVVSERDMQKALMASEAALPQGTLANRRIIHSIPLYYTVDGQKVLGKSPAGMRGMRVGVETLFIMCLKTHVDAFVEAVEAAGIEVEDIVASPIAASFVTLTKMQKRVGCVLVNIGSETLSLAIFEEETPVSVKVFPTGASEIAGDIALGLRIPLEEAEQLKHGAVLGAPYSRKKLDDIIGKRISTMFKLVDAHLKQMGKNELLPAGVVLTGGGAGVSTVSELAAAVLRLPSRVAPLSLSETGRMQMKDGSWAVAYGLTIWGLTAHHDLEPREVGTFRDAFGGVWKVLKRFLP